MNSLSRSHLRALLFLLCVAPILLASCEDKSSTIGAGWYKDTVAYKVDTIAAASSIVRYQPSTKSTVSFGGQSYNMTNGSAIMIVGRSNDATENIESWGVMRFPVLSSDQLARAKSVRLLLHTIAYKYGADSANTNVDLNLFAQLGGGAITDSTTAIDPSVLTTEPVGSYVGPMPDTTGGTVSFSIDSSMIPYLSATSFAFVLEPGATMNHCVSFGTIDGAVAYRPILEYTLSSDTGDVTIDTSTSLDMHVMQDHTPSLPGEFSLRGSESKRLFISLDLTRLADSLGLSRFTTMNSAVLELHLDQAHSRRSNLSFDTLGPVVIRYTGQSDTSVSYYGAMSRDPSDPTLYTIQISTLLELWLHDSTQYHGLELRAGWNYHTIAGTSVGVEDNTLNYWSFYGPDATDPTKRPRVTLAFSALK